MELLNSFLVSVVLFASSNIDDIFVLVSFFADPKYPARHIIIGQYAGIAALVLVSLLASLVSLVLPAAYVGLLGGVPVLIGLKKIHELKKESEPEAETETPRKLGNILAVAAVTVANGGDNIGIYTPVFATNNMTAIIITVMVFTIMVAIWLGLAYWLTNHQKLGAPIKKYGYLVTPFVLIAIGIFVMYEAGTFALMR